MGADTREQSEFPVAAGVLLGLGLGGFFDGIVLHQILQWHHMFSSTGRWSTTTIHGLKINTLGDGLFHAGTFILTVVGLVLLWRAARLPHEPWSSRALLGTLLLGWGLFNTVEGLIDHEILGIHHVRSGPHHLLWDLGFLLWGVVMLASGWALLAARQAPAAPAGLG